MQYPIELSNLPDNLRPRTDTPKGGGNLFRTEK